MEFNDTDSITDDKADFARLKNEILRREKRAAFQKRLLLLAVLVITVVLIYYLS